MSIVISRLAQFRAECVAFVGLVVHDKHDVGLLSSLLSNRKLGTHSFYKPLKSTATATARSTASSSSISSNSSRLQNV